MTDNPISGPAKMREQQHQQISTRPISRKPTWRMMVRIAFWAHLIASYAFVAAGFARTGDMGRQWILITGWFAPLWVPVLYLYFEWILVFKGMNWWQGGYSDLIFLTVSYPVPFIVCFALLYRRCRRGTKGT